MDTTDVKIDQEAIQAEANVSIKVINHLLGQIMQGYSAAATSFLGSGKVGELAKVEEKDIRAVLVEHLKVKNPGMDDAQAAEAIKDGIINLFASEGILNPAKDPSVKAGIVAKYAADEQGLRASVINMEALNLRAAAIKAQSVARRREAVNEAEAKRKQGILEGKAASTIEGVWRGYKLRQKRINPDPSLTVEQMLTVDQDDPAFKTIREIVKENTEEALKKEKVRKAAMPNAALQFQRHFRGQMVRKHNRVIAEAEKVVKERPLTQEELLALERAAAALTIQRYERGSKLRKRYTELLKEHRKKLKDSGKDDGRFDGDDLDAEDDKKRSNYAATIIQQNWRKYILKKDAKAKVEAAEKLAREVDEIAKKRADGYPKHIDRVQMAHELDQSQRPVQFYNAITKKFEPIANRKPLQGNWIEGINGYESDYELDKDGKKVKKAPISYKHLGIDRSHLHPKDRIYIDENGFAVADYENIFALQFDINKARRKHEESRLPGAPKLLKAGESRTSFARYKHKVYVDGKFVREEERYAMLIQTQESLTEVFVKDEVVTGRINRSKESLLKEALEKRSNKEDAANYIANPAARQAAAETEANKAFAENNARYKDLLTAAWVACADIKDPAARQEAAEKMVRQEVREQMMVQITKEVEEARRQSSASHQLDAGDLLKLSTAIPTTWKNRGARGAVGLGMAAGLTVGTMGLAIGHPLDVAREISKYNPVKTTQEKFQIRAASHLKRIPDGVSNYIDHGGVSISKNRRGAKVTFNGGDPHDVMWINLPNTSFYVRAACATEDGLYETFVDGASKMVHRKAGETWVAENTVFFNDGTGYQPWCVHTPVVGINQANSLKYNQLARTQGGPDGFKGVRKMYDNFALQVNANIGDTRSVTVKVKGYPAASMILDPVAFKDKDNRQVKFTKKLPDITEIPTMTVAALSKSPWLEKEAYFKCPALDMGDPDVKRNPTDKQSAEEDAAREASKATASKFGPMFVRAELGIDGELAPELVPYRIVRGKYEKFTRADLVEELKEQGVDAKYIDKFADRFFERFASVKLKGHAVDEQFRQKEEDLHSHIVDEDATKAKAVIQEYVDRKAAIEARIASGSVTTEERAAIYRNATFDINAVMDNGQTALHAAAAKGQEDVVAALLAAGANPNIKDKNGKTPAQLARKNGHFDASVKNHWVAKLESAEEQFKVTQAAEEAKELVRNAKVLRARADKLRADLVTLTTDVSKILAAHEARHDLAVAGPNAHATTVTAGPTLPVAAAKAQDVSQAKVKEIAELKSKYEEAEKIAAAAEAKLVKKPEAAKVDPKKVIPDPFDGKYETIPYRVDLGNGKYIEINGYFAREDCFVTVFEDGKPHNVPLKAGEKIFDKNTAHYFDGSVTGGDATPKMGTNILWAKVKPALPKGWKQDEWDKAFETYKKFDAKTGIMKGEKTVGVEPAWFTQLRTDLDLKAKAAAATAAVTASDVKLEFPTAASARDPFASASTPASSTVVPAGATPKAVAAATPASLSGASSSTPAGSTVSAVTTTTTPVGPATPTPPAPAADSAEAIAKEMVANMKKLGSKHLILDFDGTVLNTHTVHNAATAEKFINEGATDSGMAAGKRYSDTATLKAPETRDPKASTDELFADLPLFKAILEECKAKGIEVSIASKQHSQIVTAILRESGISDQLIPDKSILGPVNKAAAVRSITGAVPGSAVYIDDSAKERDEVATAHGAAVTCLGEDMPEYSGPACVAQEKKDGGFGLTATRVKRISATIAHAAVRPPTPEPASPTAKNLSTAKTVTPTATTTHLEAEKAKAAAAAEAARLVALSK